MHGAWTLLGAPLNSAAAGEGEELAPAALRAAGLVERLAMTDAGDVTGRLTDRMRDAGTGVIAFRQLLAASVALRAAVAGVARPFVVGGDCSLLPGALAADPRARARRARGPPARDAGRGRRR